MALTPKQERFCQEYVVDLNGTQAAVRAGYSPRTANEIAAENLAKPSIKQRVAELQDERAGVVGVTAADVLRGLLAEAKFRGKGTSHAARVTAWATVGKHLGMFEERVKVEQVGKLVIKRVVVRVDRGPHATGPAGD